MFCHNNTCHFILNINVYLYCTILIKFTTRREIEVYFLALQNPLYYEKDLFFNIERCFKQFYEKIYNQV